MSEEWRPIPGYEGLYEASSLGNIRNRRGRLIGNKRLSDWGYKQKAWITRRKKYGRKGHAGSYSR